jgi:hypothetical protein
MNATITDLASQVVSPFMNTVRWLVENTGVQYSNRESRFGTQDGMLSDEFRTTPLTLNLLSHKPASRALTYISKRCTPKGYFTPIPLLFISSTNKTKRPSLSKAQFHKQSVPGISDLFSHSILLILHIRLLVISDMLLSHHPLLTSMEPLAQHHQGPGQ